MKILDLLTELRKNPEKNPKVSVYSAIEKYLPDYDDELGLFLSFTAIDKLGINPGSKYDTPLGIYAYTAAYVKHATNSGAHGMANLPFASDEPYANIFTLTNSNGLIVISGFSKQEYEEYIDKIRNMLLSSSFRFSMNVNGVLDELIDDAIEEAKVPTPGGSLWYVTMELAKYLNEQGLINSPVPVIWNKIFRMIGVTAVIDEGAGIIHTNEPSQAVIFDPRIIKLLERVINSPSTAEPYLRRRYVKGNLNKQDIQFHKKSTQNLPFDDKVQYYLSNPGALRFIKDRAVRDAVLIKEPLLIRFINHPTVQEWARYIENQGRDLETGEVRRMQQQKKLLPLINLLATHSTTSIAMSRLLQTNPEWFFKIDLTKLDNMQVSFMVDDLITGFKRNHKLSDKVRMNYFIKYIFNSGHKEAALTLKRVASD